MKEEITKIKLPSKFEDFNETRKNGFLKMKELKELDANALAEKLENAKAQLNQLKLNHSIAPLENPSQIKAARRDIARIETELRQRELNK